MNYQCCTPPFIPPFDEGQSITRTPAWWVFVLIGLAALTFTWLAHYRPESGWQFDGPPGCPDVLAKILTVGLGSCLIIFGLIGASVPTVLDGLAGSTRYISNLASAWETIVGMIVVGIVLYYFIFAPDEKPDAGEAADTSDGPIEDGLGRGCLVILIIAWLAWIGISGYWRELLEPFANLF